jgi:uncharacterized protein YdaU (DUF1376 family)
LKKGKMKARKVGKRWHVSEDGLKEFFSKPENQWTRKSIAHPETQGE